MAGWSTVNNAGTSFTTEMAVEIFHNEAKYWWAYQPMNLRQYTDIRTGVIGPRTPYDFFRSVTASKRGDIRTRIPVTRSHGDRVWCEMDTYVVADYSDRFGQTDTSHDELAMQGQNFARAMGEMQDQIIIDAISAGIPKTDVYGDGRREQNLGYNIPPKYYLKKTAQNNNFTTDDDIIEPLPDSTYVGGANANPRVVGIIESLLRVRTYMNDHSVPMQGRCVMMSAYVEEQLLRDPNFRNADLNYKKVMPDGTINNTFLGFNFMIVPQSELAGLPNTAKANGYDTHFTCYKDMLVWHPMCVGYAVAMDLEMNTEYQLDHLSYYTVAALKSGAVTKEGLGCARIQVAL